MRSRLDALERTVDNLRRSAVRRKENDEPEAAAEPVPPSSAAQQVPVAPPRIPDRPPESETEPDAAPASEREPGPEPEPDAAPASEREPEPEPEPAPQSAPESDLDLDSEPVRELPGTDPVPAEPTRTPRPAPAPRPTPAPASATSPASGPAPAPRPAVPATRRLQAPRRPAKPPGPTLAAVAVARARTWLLTGNSPVKIGIIVSLIGLGFLLREAAVRGWVDFTIEIRLAAATAFGLGLLAFGWLQRTSRPIYGRSLQGGGIAVLYLVTLAAYALYDLVAPLAALAAVVLITVAAGALAMIQGSLTLAMLGLIGGFSAPLLAFAWPQDHFEVFGFYAVLGVAVVAVSRLKAWPTLVLSGYGFTFVVAGLWLFAREEHSDWLQLQPFVAFFVLLYTLVPLVWPPVPSSREEPVGFSDAWINPLLFCTPFAGLAMQALLVGHLRYGVAVSSAVLAVMHAAFHQLSRRLGNTSKQFEVAYAALAVVFCATAVPLFLGASATSAIWAVQGAVLVWASSRWGSRLALLGGAVLQAIAAVAYGVRITTDSVDWDSPAVFGFWAEATPVLNVYALGAIMLAACGLASAESLRRSSRFDPWRLSVQIAALVWGAGWFLFAETAAVWLRFGLLPTVGLWAVQGAAVTWMASRRRSMPVAVVGVAMQAVAAVAAVFKLSDDAAGLSPGSFEFWADTLPVVNQYFAITAFLAVCGFASATAISRFVGDRDDAWRAVMYSALALGGAWLLFAESAEMWVRAGPFAVSTLWTVEGAVLVWLAARRRMAVGDVLGTLLQFAAAGVYAARSVEDYLATEGADRSSALSFWADETTVLNPYFGVAVLLAICGVASALIGYRSSSALGELRVPLMWLSLLWGVGWWLYAAAAQIWVVTDDYRLWGLSLLVFGTLSALVAAGRALRWNELEWAGVLMLPTLGVALVVALASKDYPSADWGWTAWPFMFVAYAAFLRTGGDRLKATGLYGGLYCLASVFLAAEVYGQLAQVADGAWPLYGAAAAVLLWMEASLLVRPVASWFVGDGWRCCLLYGITPVVWAAAAGVGIAVVNHHGDVDPLLFLPILNPIDIFAAASVILLLRWKREMVAELSADSDSLTPAIGSLLRLAATPWLPVLSAASVVALTMSAARTVHHWAGVPFELRSLVYSTELQVAVSILWAAIALAAMVAGVRAGDRRIWIVGASWMGIVVIKLFLVDLASLAALPKAGSFIGVGIVLLIVGYLAPVPPSQAKAERSEDDPETHSRSSSETVE
ncbi:DUF2339 domain-containing protein [Candidatus Poriferisodalis sp.]|uniref:DUF2339 domain-containing protein n=1 Tax=Candidatus Poriferisodalis sp. TaxID=3101277 RepID=UPI003B02A59B